MNLDMNALRCLDCGAVEREPNGVEDGEECIKCESENTMAVRIDDEGTILT